MKETWNGNTRELGAGSYPEPPAVREEERLCCEECGWERDLEGVKLTQFKRGRTSFEPVALARLCHMLKNR